MAFNESIAQRIEDYFISHRVDYFAKKMFGGLCFMVDDKMCVGVVGEQLMARIGPDVYEQSLEKEHCNPMDFTGKAMKGFVYINPEGMINDADLYNWLDLALQFNPLAKASKKKKN